MLICLWLTKWQVVVFDSLYNSMSRKDQNKTKKIWDERKPWLTHCIITSVKHKNKPYRTFLEKKASECKTAYTKYTNILTATIWKSEKLCYTQSFEKYSGNSRETWRHINSILQTTRGIKIQDPIVIKSQGQLITFISLA